MMLKAFEQSKCRLLTIIISSLSLLILLVFYVLSPAPSSVVTNYTPHHQKVSIVLCFHQPSPAGILHTERNLQKVLSTMKLEYETLIVLPPHFSAVKDITSLLPSSSLNHHHIEIVSETTCSNAFYKAHFSVLLLIGANLTSFEDSIPRLVEPVLNGQSDLILADTPNQAAAGSIWKKFLSLLVSPITGIIHVPNTHVLSMLTPVWTHGCHNIDSDQGSFSIELICRCSIKNWSTTFVHISESSDHAHICLSQVLSLWWNLHPLLCLLMGVVTILLVSIVTVTTFKKRKKIVFDNKLEIY